MRSHPIFRTTFILLTFSLLLLVLQGSGDPEKSKPSEPMTAEQPKMMLRNGEWELNYMMGTAGSVQDYFGGFPVIKISTDDQSISGFSGCNQFRGEVVANGSNISWKGEFAVTRRLALTWTLKRIFSQR
jgi:heat shock protein HslJ